MSKKREANAGQRRKARAPVVSEESMKRHNEAISDRELWQLSNRLEELERLRKAGILNTPFIALEALGALSGGVVTGRSEDQLRTTWPKEWGDETITVPLALILALRAVWSDYKQAPSGTSVGEVFKIEGGGQGKHPMKSKLEAIDSARPLARQVLVRYLQLENDEQPLSVVDAIREVATENSISYQTVEKAYREHRKQILPILEELGIVKSAKSSGS